MDKLVKKNILDLEFQKYLVTASTAVVVGVTYLIGIAISFVTKQIKLNDLISMLVIVILSSIILSICVSFFQRAIRNMKNIVETIKEMG